MIQHEGAFQSVGGDVASAPIAADVADEHMNPRQDAEDLARQPPHLRLAGQIRDKRLDSSTGGGDLTGHRVGARGPGR